MAKRKPEWNKYEAVLLLEAYLKIECGIDKTSVIKQTSEALRKMAINCGMEIDAVFRNVAGITFQMKSMESAYLGHTVMKPATKLFSKIVDLYRNKRCEYEKLVKEARQLVSGLESAEKQFERFLLSEFDEANCNMYLNCCKVIDQFCNKIKIIDRPLLEITESSTLERVRKTIEKNKIFIVVNRKNYHKIVEAFWVYLNFINNQKDAFEHQCIEEGTFHQETETEAYQDSDDCASEKEYNSDLVSCNSNSDDENRFDRSCENISEAYSAFVESAPETDENAAEDKLKECPRYEMVVTDQDARLMQKYSDVFVDVFLTLQKCSKKNSGGIKVPYIFEELEHGAKYAIVEKILNNASWSMRDGIYYRFSGDAVHAMNTDLVKSEELIDVTGDAMDESAVRLIDSAVQSDDRDCFEKEEIAEVADVFEVEHPVGEEQAQEETEDVPTSDEQRIQDFLKEESIKNKFGTTGVYIQQSLGIPLATIKSVLREATWAKFEYGRYHFVESVPVVEKKTADIKKRDSRFDEMITTDQDAQLMQKYSDVFIKVFFALRDYSAKNKEGTTVAYLYTQIRQGVKCVAIEDILNHASWSMREGTRYRFAYALGSSAKIEKISAAEEQLCTDVVETIDFSNYQSLDETVPVSFEYFGEEKNGFSSWEDMYVNIVATLLDDYSDLLRIGMSFEEGSDGIDLGGVVHKVRMKLPRNIADTALYLECGMTASDMMRKIKCLLDKCYVDYENLVIKFRKNNKKSEEELLKEQYPALYKNVYAISKIYNGPRGLSVARIMQMAGNWFERKDVVDFLDRVPWATKISEGFYSFEATVKPRPNKSGKAVLESNKRAERSERTEQKAQSERKEQIPTDFDKTEFEQVLMTRFQTGIQFDSIDMDNFRDTYESLFDQKLNFSDHELEQRLKLCGVNYKGRIFPAKGIIGDTEKTKLFEYIESSFSVGNKVLYYKAIMTDLSDVFVYCFNLTDEMMLKAFIEYTAEKGKYFFQDKYMSCEKEVKIDHVAEIAEYMLSEGKPLSFDEIYAGLSHISNEIIYREITTNSCFVRNEKGHYFHNGIFEYSPEDGERISTLIQKEIDENGYALWSRVFQHLQSQMPVFLENNLYLSSLGVRNALSRHLGDKFNFKSEVISALGEELSMADVYRRFGKYHAPFSDDDLYAFSKEIDTVIYFTALYEEVVRVSRHLFIAKEMITFDVDAVDKAIETYLSGGYIFMKDVDSFLMFPNVGHEWNQFLLESFLLGYSKKFVLLNNGTSLNNVAGAIVKKDGEYKHFVDVCAHVLAESEIELKKDFSLDYLVEKNLITRRSYREVDDAMTKARRLRNEKG